MRQTTQSWAPPEEAPAMQTWDSEGLLSSLADNRVSTLPYTPNIMAFCRDTAAREGAIPLNKPNT